ncbi:hypothetical protein C8F01DRAFT_1325642 [Mycena amicta]|nr:hypothetical protein C8F01DRAFT_1325642 [Mycena amicta]
MEDQQNISLEALSPGPQQPRILPTSSSSTNRAFFVFFAGIGTVPYTGTAVLLRVKYGADRTVTVPYARLPRPVRVRYGYGTAVYGYGRRYGTSIVMEPRGWVQSVGEACTNFLEGAGADLEQEERAHWYLGWAGRLIPLAGIYQNGAPDVAKTRQRHPDDIPTTSVPIPTLAGLFRQ